MNQCCITCEYIEIHDPENLALIRLGLKSKPFRMSCTKDRHRKLQNAKITSRTQYKRYGSTCQLYKPMEV